MTTITLDRLVLMRDALGLAHAFLVAEAKHTANWHEKYNRVVEAHSIATVAVQRALEVTQVEITP